MPGESLQFYTGMRTKQCRKLVEDDPLCVSVQRIEMHETDSEIGCIVLLEVLGTGKLAPLSTQRIEQLAIDDGFESTSEFVEFFRKTHGFSFYGYLIRCRGNNSVLIQQAYRFDKNTPSGEYLKGLIKACERQAYSQLQDILSQDPRAYVVKAWWDSEPQILSEDYLIPTFTRSFFIRIALANPDEAKSGEEVYYKSLLIPSDALKSIKDKTFRLPPGDREVRIAVF